MRKDKNQMRNSQYTKEFRDSTVQLAMNSDKSAMQIAKDLDVNEKTLYNWIREYKKANNIQIVLRVDSTVSSSKNTVKETLEKEAKRLRVENKLLRQDRYILKKATAYFAKEESKRNCNNFMG